METDAPKEDITAREKADETQEQAETAAEEEAVDWELTNKLAFGDNTKSRSRAGRVRRFVEEKKAEEEIETESLDELAGELDEALGRDESKGIAFGEKGVGWIEVDVAADNKQASVLALDFADDKSLNKSMVLKALDEDFDVRFGIDGEALDELVKRAKKGEVIRERLPIAKERPAEQGKAGRIDYPCLEKLEKDQTLPSRELYDALQKEDLETVLSHCPYAVMVVPGQVLAVVVPPGDGKAGKTVDGEEYILPGEEASLDYAEHVVEEEGRFLSEIYGYVCIVQERLTVVSPIWLSKDKLEARFIHYPQPVQGAKAEAEWLAKLLELKSVTSGIDDSCIELLTGKPPENKAYSDVIAKGHPAVDGSDTHIAYTFDPEKKPGRFHDDGSIDLRERNVVITAEEGQLLGELKAASNGEPGLTVTGEILPAKNGEKRSFKGGGNVRIEEEDGIPKFFYAEITGNVKVREDTVLMEKMFEIDGSVDYDTGNIDVPTDVYIKGSVVTGFSVKSKGSITVEGTVEPGASLYAREDIIVAKGITGQKTQVIAQGNIETKFIQNSFVLANGDIKVGGYIFNAPVRAGGSILINEAKEKRGGSIVGGEVFAGKGIEAKLLGSESTDRTLVGTRGSPQAEFRLNQHKKTIDQCNVAMLKILRTLGIQKVNTEALRSCLRRTPAIRKKATAELIRSLQEMVEKKKKATEAQEKVLESIKEEIESSTLKISKEIFPDVMIQIGSEVENIPEKLKGQVFYLDEEGIKWRPL